MGAPVEAILREGLAVRLAGLWIALIGTALLVAMLAGPPTNNASLLIWSLVAALGGIAVAGGYRYISPIVRR